MSRFLKDKFDGSEYVTYEGKFVARFKYNRVSKGTFITFLVKNFTVEEYFSRLNAGEAPLTILESKGYMLPHIRKLLKALGYDQTRQGLDKYIQDQIKTRQQNQILAAA
jgi:hypothetical protein